MKILLDTCTFLWLAERSPKLSKTATSVFLNPDYEMYMSVVSAWEIAIKFATGRLPLPQRPDIYIPVIREQAGVDSLELDEESATHTARLPRVHDDPFDRLLVAQAIVHGLTILTPDPAIHQYPVRVLW